MPRRRFTRPEIASFQWAVARGERPSDVAREHGFSVSNFSRWCHKYGVPYVPYVPTAADLRGVRAWRAAPTLAEAWRSFHAFVTGGSWWPMGGELPPLDVDPAQDWLRLHARPDARVVLVCEKAFVSDLAREWRGPRRPSAAEIAKAAVANTAWPPSRWAARALEEHARASRAHFAYVGDLDPQALHSFATLRAGGTEGLLGQETAPAIPVRWIGLDSEWLDWVCATANTTEVPSWMTLPLGWTDREYWALVKRLVPDARRLLGERASAMLDSGTKLEIDALFIGPLREAALVELARRLASSSRDLGALRL